MMTEQLDPEPLAEEEAAFLRHLRFGELPAPVGPADLTALVETDPPHESPPSPDEWLG